MKRMVDFIFAFICIIIFSPLFFLTAILVRLYIGTPIIFKQLRPGLNSLPFYIYKFRTMTNEKDNDGNLLSDEIRLTAFGKFLRRLSIDELPQLINVIKGELSFVGPRPLLMEYLPLYTTEQLRRHNVRPGITGWAQVNGRNSISWEEKFKLDIWYVDNQSFWLDLKIILITITRIIQRSGINQEGSVTVEKFRGSVNLEAKIK